MGGSGSGGTNGPGGGGNGGGKYALPIFHQVTFALQ